MVTTITALTPATHSSVKFIYAPERAEFSDFRMWAEENDATSLRWYTILQQGTETLGVGDLDVELRRTEVEIVIAYPHHWGTYGGDNASEMDDTIESDRNQVEKAVGYRGSANYLAGQHAAIEGSRSPEPGDGVTFAVIPLTVTYYYDAN